MHHPVEGTWCGATPELLLRAQQHDVDTVSLAGTRRDGSQASWTDKERQEQHVVTEHVLDVLSEMGSTNLSIHGPHDRAYGALTHLETRISAHFMGDLHQLAKALHPTPAVCGRPVDQATAFIRTKEQHNRTYYAGFLGWSSPWAARTTSICAARGGQTTAWCSSQEVGLWRVLSLRMNG